MTELNKLAFLYGGFGQRSGSDGSIIDEHQLLRESPPRYPGHIQYLYELSDVRGGVIVHDSKFTTESGWDDTNEEVMRRYIQLARYAGINTLSFAIYGGVNSATGAGELELTKPVENYLRDIDANFPDMKFSPMICLRSPRKKLPIEVPVRYKDESPRHAQVSDQSMQFIVEEVFEKYYEQYAENFLHINGRPALFMFDYPRMAVNNWYGITEEGVSRTITDLKENISRRYGVVPLFIGIFSSMQELAVANDYPLDMASNYITLPYYEQARAWPVQEYSELVDRRISEWGKVDELFDKSYIPSIVSGFDASSRIAPVGAGRSISKEKYNDEFWYPLIPHIPNNENRVLHYKRFLRAGLMRAVAKSLPIFNLGPLNELTEQAALLPYYTADAEERRIDLIELVRDIKIT